MINKLTLFLLNNLRHIKKILAIIMLLFALYIIAAYIYLGDMDAIPYNYIAFGVCVGIIIIFYFIKDIERRAKQPKK